MNVAIVFGRVLRGLRKQAGLTQEQLGFEAELERNYISMLERGKRQPTLKTILQLSQPLQRSASQLVALVEASIPSDLVESGSPADHH